MCYLNCVRASKWYPNNVALTQLLMCCGISSAGTKQAAEHGTTASELSIQVRMSETDGLSSNFSASRAVVGNHCSDTSPA